MDVFSLIDELVKNGKLSKKAGEEVKKKAFEFGDHRYDSGWDACALDHRSGIS